MAEGAKQPGELVRMEQPDLFRGLQPYAAATATLTNKRGWKGESPPLTLTRLQIKNILQVSQSPAEVM